MERPPTYPPPQNVPPNSSGCCRLNRNRPQSYSLGAATLIFLSGGMNMAWSFGYFVFNYEIIITKHTINCWFIGAIIGAFLGALLTNFLRKKYMMLISSCLTLLGGILLTSLDNNARAITAARYFDGIATGFIFVPTLILVGEEANKTIRGFLAASITTESFAVGILLQILFFVNWVQKLYVSFSMTQMQGVIAIICGVVAFIMAALLLIESPIYFLQRNDDLQAIESLKNLQTPNVVTHETYEQLEQCKNYIAYNNALNFNNLAMRGALALMKLIFYRGISALFLNFLPNSTFLIAVSYGLGSEYVVVLWPFTLFGLLRLFGVSIGMSIIDSNRKFPIIISGFICAGLSFGIAAIFNDPWNILISEKMVTAMSLLLTHQCFAGIFATSSSAYLCEGFPLKVKPIGIACVFIVEMIIYIITSDGSYTTRDLSTYFNAVGSLTIIFAIFGIFCLPETKKLTLRQAQEKFCQFLNIR